MPQSLAGHLGATVMTIRAAHTKPAKSKDDDNASQDDPQDLVRFCRAKANECMGRAAATRDTEARTEWIILANGWTQLAVYADRRISSSQRRAAHAKT